jgi:dienelactone hydrolase
MQRSLLTALAFSLASSVSAQTISLKPDGPITGRGLPANTDIQLRSERVINDWMTGKPVLYVANGTFKADASGVVNLNKMVPSTGDYKKADVRGLFWSANPTKDPVPDGAKRNLVKLSVRADGKVLTSREIQMQSVSPDLIVEEKIDKLPGAIFATNRKAKEGEKRPAIIALGGSEGGNASVNRMTRDLASLGYAVLSFPYYSPQSWQTKKQEVPELPAGFVDIPVERLNIARDYLKSRGDVDTDRIALYGVSKGAEYVALAAAHLEWPKAIVAVVPSDVVWEGWNTAADLAPDSKPSFSLNGKPLAYTPYLEFGQEFAGAGLGEDIRIRRPQDKGRAASPERAAKARIPIERYKGAVMVIAGQEDQVWNSAMMAHNMAERRAEAGRETTSLIFVDAGHYLSGDGWSPTTQYNAGPSKSGGTPQGNAHAQAVSWAKTIEFLRSKL